MFQNLEVFKMSHAMASHAGTRQALVAQNIANADTPGYLARDIPAFRDLYESDRPYTGMRATRDMHLNGAPSSPAERSMGTLEPHLRETGVSESPNENNVSLELETLMGVEVKRQHDRAIAIYKSTLGVLRSSLSRN